MKKVIILLIPILFLVGCDSTEEFSKVCTRKIKSLNITDTTKSKIIYNNRDEVVKIIESEFPDSEYRNFFRGWVEHAFREKKGQQSMRKQIEKDVRDSDEGR